MKDVFRLMLLPLQAPMLLLLVGVSTYQGMHWSHALEADGSKMQELTTLLLIRPEIIIQTEEEDRLFKGLSDRIGSCAYVGY